MIWSALVKFLFNGATLMRKFIIFGGFMKRMIYIAVMLLAGCAGYLPIICDTCNALH